jgi:DNA-binding transcriptional MerR regulator
VRTYNALTKNGVELFNDADSLLKKIATLAKELGVSVNDVPEFNDVKDALNKFLDAQQDMDSSFEMLKKEL